MIIGISGRIGSGKDTVGEIIQYLTSPNIASKGTYEECKQNGYTYDVVFENRKFADKLKEMVCMMLGCTREKLEDRDFKETPLSQDWWYIKKWYPINPNSDKVFTLIPYKEFDSRVFDGDHACMWQVVKTTPRLLMQLLGTDCGRDILHPNLWVNSTMVDYKPELTVGVTSYDDKDSPTIEAHGLGFPNWIITDMRFPNEANAVKEKEGICIRINRIVGKEVVPNENWGSNTTSINQATIIKDYGNEYLIRTKEGNELNIYPHEVDIVKKEEHASETGLDNYNKWDYIIENNGTLGELVEKVRKILIENNIINEEKKEKQNEKNTFKST